MENHQRSTFLVHYGELALKGGRRSWFEKRLVRNIKSSLHDISACTVRQLPGRIIVDFADNEYSQKALARLTRVFGVANVSPVMCVSSDLAQIAQAVHKLIEGKNFQSFAVRCKRAEKKFPLTSMEVSAHLGALVAKDTGARVDLTTPEQEIGIEILTRHTFVYSDRFFGPGGLPCGSAGKVLCLLSGGIDSPVAAWRMMKRGCMPIYLHFTSFPYASRASVEKVKDMVEKLSEGLEKVELIVVPFGEIQQKIGAAVPARYRVLMYRRMMLRIAEKIAQEKGAQALVTGEALSQVASQTLANLRAIEAVATLPVLRPLIGMDKQEIVDEAKKIGTFITSCEPHDDCCSFLMPPHPATESTIQELNEMEELLLIPEMLEQGVCDKEETSFGVRHFA